MRILVILALLSIVALGVCAGAAVTGSDLPAAAELASDGADAVIVAVADPEPPRPAAAVPAIAAAAASIPSREPSRIFRPPRS
ncbi:MAG TPA: hypothetical protein VL172_05370 [Kofleriaceae bacterium]|nr:hypothetical protein [Kofleriaceae bacterium]